MELKIEYLPLDALTPYERNARKHEAADVETIKNSIREFEMCDPIGIWGDKNIIVEGHGRLLALKQLGHTHAPCIRLDHLTDEQRRAYALAHNKTAEMSEWDFDKVEAEIAALEMDMTQFGFEDFDDEETADVVEDEAPEIDEEAPPVTKLGDIWQLGRHRLMCGDSTDPLNIDVLMNGNKADLVFTDPPYGVGFESKGVANDNQNADELLNFNKQWIPLSFEALKENGSWYCWGVDTSLMDIYAFIIRPLEKEHKVSLRNLLTWDKGLGQNQNDANMRSYPAADEKCLFVMSGWEQTVSFTVNKEDYNPKMDKIRIYMSGEAERLEITPAKIKEICGVGMYSHWFSKSQFSLPTKEQYQKLQKYYKAVGGFGKEYDELKKEYDELKKEYDELKKEYDELKKEFYGNRAYFDNTHDNMNNVWHFPRTSGEERELAGGHATPKPIALCSRAIKSSSREGEIVLDVFGGSGSTLIACEQLNRSAYVMELEPKWCDVIVKRWETLTGEKAVRL